MKKILIYSHDSFGLGHLRRCRKIAQFLVARHERLSVLILSGSSYVGHFDFSKRVACIQLPGVCKKADGRYAPVRPEDDLGETLARRAALIEQSARHFQPDVFLVDKQPLGVGKELLPVLRLLSGTKTRCVLGVRDILDKPATVRAEWGNEAVFFALSHFYTAIWVYGTRAFYDPLQGLALPPALQEKSVSLGHLCESPDADFPPQEEPSRAPYLLVTVGGGGDGEKLIDWVLRAYASADAAQEKRALPSVIIVPGPFMPPEAQLRFRRRAAALSSVSMIGFSPRLEQMIARAQGVVSMSGYNTFCEILGANKPALLYPRRTPRYEQSIRAARAHELGLARMIAPEAYPDEKRMRQALSRLATQPPPSESAFYHRDAFLDGLENMGREVRHLLEMPDDQKAPALEKI